MSGWPEHIRMQAERRLTWPETEPDQTRSPFLTAGKAAMSKISGAWYGQLDEVICRETATSCQRTTFKVQGPVLDATLDCHITEVRLKVLTRSRVTQRRLLVKVPVHNGRSLNGAPHLLELLGHAGWNHVRSLQERSERKHDMAFSFGPGNLAGFPWYFRVRRFKKRHPCQGPSTHTRTLAQNGRQTARSQ